MLNRIKTDSPTQVEPVESEDISEYPETICHRSIRGDPAFYPQAEFHGRTLYFCTEVCKSVFQSDPERFFVAHSKRRS